MDSISKKGSEYYDALSEGLMSARNNSLAERDENNEMVKNADGTIKLDQDKLFENGDLNKYAKIMARIQGQAIDAFSVRDGDKIHFNDEAAAEYFKIAKPAWHDDFDADNLKVDKVMAKFNIDETLARGIVGQLQKAITEVTTTTLVNMDRGGYDREIIRRFIGIIKQEEKNNGEDEKTKIIENNTYLTGYKDGIEPEVK
jgi:hypothetical protein